jgi:hypothetical protein
MSRGGYPSHALGRMWLAPAHHSGGIAVVDCVEDELRVPRGWRSQLLEHAVEMERKALITSSLAYATAAA